MRHVIFSMIFFSILTPSALFASSATENEKTVRSFYELAFNQHQPRAAAKKYIGKEYTQHNPYVQSGSTAFVEFFENYLKKNATISTSVKRVIATKDYVVVHAHSRSGPKDRGRAVMDIFRMSNGKIVEHWDVSQNIPEKIVHNNTMF